jgi:hypothetical protein
MIIGRQTKCIFKVNNIFRLSVLPLHVSARQESHVLGAQRILMKLYVYYVMSDVAYAQFV